MATSRCFPRIPSVCTGVWRASDFSFLLHVYPFVPIEVLRAESERQASLVLGMALRNRDRLRQIIDDESIDCDFSPRGWIYLAHTDSEEQAMCEEVMLAAQHGQRIELWSRRKILEEFDIRTDFVGRFIPGYGTYHPFKYVCGVISAALKNGVELYTRVRVKRIRSMSPDRHYVTTDRGCIVARRVIVATNAFTCELLPEMRSISPQQSQIMLTEHALDRARGRSITTEQGPAFFNQPRAEARNGRAPLLFGGGKDRPMKNPASRRRSLGIHHQLLRLRDRYYPELCGQPPTSEWVGPMAFTPDALPAIGFVRPGVILAAGFNGYGGSYCTAAGQASAEMALTDESPRLDAAGCLLPAPVPQQTPFVPLVQRQSLANRTGTLQAVDRGQRTDLLRVYLRCDQRPERNAEDFTHDAAADDLAGGVDDPAGCAVGLSALC